MTSAFSFSNVARIYPNGVKALENFSLNVSQGERVSLIGPSGCGKSTVLRLLAQLDETPAGTIDRKGIETCGYVFQDATLMPWATVFDNVYLPLKLNGVSRENARQRVDALLASMGLSEFGSAWPRELSGGMKMRVSIARALIGKPDLLLLDEPFAALDEITRFRLNDLMLKLQELDGFTLLFVTHSVFESVYLSDRIAVMTNRPGKVFQEIETPNESLSGDAYRASEQYSKSCAAVSAALRDAMKHNQPARV